MVVVTGGTLEYGGAQVGDLGRRDGVTRAAYRGSRQPGRGAWIDELPADSGTSTITKSEVSPMKSFLLVLVAAIALAGCSSDGSDGALPTPSSVDESDAPTTSTTVESTSSAPQATTAPETSPTTEPTTAVLTPIEEVIADQIRGYFDARGAANAAPAPNSDDPRLAEFSVGEELAAVVANTQTRLDSGQAIRPGDEGLADIRVGFVDAGASGASAAACAVDDGVIYDLASDVVVNDDVVTHNYQIDLELHDGVWKVSRIVRVQQWEGVAGCALSPADYPF